MSIPIRSRSIPGPVEEGRRILSIDVLRGVALLCILLMNIVAMALPHPAYWDPSGYGGDKGWNLWVFGANNMLVEGSMRGLFSMLFGAGVILFTFGKEPEQTGPEGTGPSGMAPAVAIAWYRRILWLMVFGLIHAYLLIWPGEVLFQYGVAGMFLFPLRHLNAGKLIGASVVVFLVIAALNLNEASRVEDLQKNASLAKEELRGQKKLTGEQREALDNWAELQAAYKPTEERKAREIDEMRFGYLSAVRTMAPVTYYMQTSYFLRHLFPDILGTMLLGMGLFKLGVFHAGRKSRYYLRMVLAGYVIGLAVNWHETHTYIESDFSIVSYFRNLRTYDLGRVFMMLGHVGLIMLFLKTNGLAWLKRSLASVGRMALTNYIMQSLIAMVLFVVFRQYGHWERYQLYYLVPAVWVIQLITSSLWLNKYRFGPLEWLWRWLTYGKKPVFKKGS